MHSSARPEACTSSTNSRWLGDSGVCISNSLMPSTPLSGVRSSWLMWARKPNLLWRADSSARWDASSRSCQAETSKAAHSRAGVSPWETSPQSCSCHHRPSGSRQQPAGPWSSAGTLWGPSDGPEGAAPAPGPPMHACSGSSPALGACHRRSAARFAHTPRGGTPAATHKGSAASCSAWRSARKQGATMPHSRRARVPWSIGWGRWPGGPEGRSSGCATGAGGRRARCRRPPATRTVQRPRRTRSSSSRISSAAPTVIALSAMLKAGKCRPRRWKSRKSTT